MKFIFLLTFLLFSCSTKKTVKITSRPEGAQVLLRESDQSVKPLGKTPLELTGNQFSSDKLNALIVSYEGYHEQHMMMAGDNQSYDINVNLKPIIEDAKSLDSKSRQEKLAQQVVNAHQLIRQKRLLDAESLLLGVIREYPYVSVGYDLMGNVSYLKKDLQRALNYYERSLQINPENIETRQMVERLKGIGQQIQ